MPDTTKAFSFGPDTMNQYAALGNELRFHADHRFKIATAFLVANGLLANVAKDYRSMFLALVGIALSILCAAWDRKTGKWWGSLLESLKDIEKAGVREGKLVLTYRRYERVDSFWSRLKSPSGAIWRIYMVFALAWLAFLVHSYSQWWKRL